MFIHLNHQEFGIKWLCQRLNVSRQGYYRFAHRKPTSRQKKYNELRTLVINAFFTFDQKMGGQKIYDYLSNQGHELSLGFVKSVLKSHGLVSKIVKTYKKKNNPHKSFENKLDRQFEVSDNVQEIPRVVCDITEWRLQNGTKVYLCVALELAKRSIVGYKTALTCETNLVTEVIDQVQVNLPGELVLFHSDQGSQFTSKKVVRKLEALKWTQSMSRKGNCWDNAVIESFFSILKREELKWHVFHSLVQAERIVREYIDNYYMSVRPHESLGGVPPIQYILNLNLSTKTQK
ncbi:IS3 family transposase [Enterococcus faecalis]|uniref:IS3 family transposase n=1 Tax=Enterococcus faecalis TaxID=1351 RepID=UPI0003527854|nr:IS3 family transposase [Enterococcus faecalis]EPI39885.1 integrase core domain protein [Enterococcus faecalis LA3B-2]